MTVSSYCVGMPKGAITAVNDLLDHCAKIQPGQEVLLLAHIDGLYGGDNLVDQEAVSWIQAGVQARGANASVLWIDETAKPHAWRFPPVVKAAMSASDVVINFCFDLNTEEIVEFREYIKERKFRMVRNFATTASLLCTAWAQTPYELVSEIRYQASLPMIGGKKWVLTDENGTHLEGTILDPVKIPGVPGPPRYSSRREEAGGFLPWPEWMHPQIRMAHTSGVFIFDRMLSWWSRYIGVRPFFDKPVKLDINEGRITGIEGGDEADALKRFLSSMQQRLGDKVYDFYALHFGVHPQASVENHQCSSLIYRRLIEHSHSSNIHAHIGAPSPNPSYPYWMHITGDIRKPTFRVGDVLVHDGGHLNALENPAVLAIAAKYPGRPGLGPEPKSC
jgi:hypothetical protein